MFVIVQTFDLYLNFTKLFLKLFWHRTHTHQLQATDQSKNNLQAVAIEQRQETFIPRRKNTILQT
jgi:hypothetical protein